MLSFKNLLVVSSLVATFAISGCGTSKPVDQAQSQPQKQTVAAETKQPASSIVQGAQNMRDVLKDIKDQLAKKNEEKAIKISDKLEENWQIFEDKVKDKSADLYEKVEKPLGAIQAGVKIQPLDRKALEATIDELDNVLTQVQQLK